MTNALLQTNQLHKTYGKRDTAYEALRGVDLSIAPGESVAIVGKSGSGKSTLMHLLAGLDTATSGSVKVGGHDLGHMSEGELSSLRNTKFGFIFQQFFLQPRLTVLENVALPLKIANISVAESNRRAMEALEQVELTDKAKNRATDLSGGQKQRVAIARALVAGPEVIFADEPTGNLDTQTGHTVIKLLFDLHRKRHITLVVVTHDADLAKLCDRTIIIKDGKIQ
ncbi:MAG: transporter ATP-binding protein [Patescibacteria group bacterium]|nr:transporter ATP-binding protein [Patescibacteria group bacterium]